MSRRGLTLTLSAVLVVVLGILTSVLPVPYVVLVPGPVTDTLGTIGAKPVVSATGAQTYPTKGHLYLTTVGVVPGACDAHPTLWQALRAWWRQDEAVQPHPALCPPGGTAQQGQQGKEGGKAQAQRDADPTAPAGV